MNKLIVVLRKLYHFVLNFLLLSEYVLISVVMKIMCPKSLFPSYLHSRSNEKILIVGNGPSTKDINLNKLSALGFNLLCVNFFASRDSNFFTLQPKYYCVIDPAFYSENNDEIQQLKYTLNRITWDMTYICLASQNTEWISNPHISVVRLNINKYHGDFFKWWLYSKNHANFGYQNVVIAALYYCITCRVGEIYLCGVESDWHRELFVDIDNNVYRDCAHFYGVERLNLIEKGEINKGEYYKYAEFYYKTMKEYYLSSRYATKMGVNIYNFTTTSYIDVFEKIHADEI